MTRIDWAFIAELEGGLILEGYVPNAGQSGVTIATGFDIGQRNARDLAQLFGEESELYNLYLPYVGLRRAAAQTALSNNPLTISTEQAVETNRRVKQSIVSRLIQRYDSDSARYRLNNPYHRTFLQLPREAQTVIASVEFQYGSIRSGAPNFWRQVTSQDWRAAYDNLRNFGDAYATRRRREAAYLWPIVNMDLTQRWPGIPYRLDVFTHPTPVPAWPGPPWRVDALITPRRAPDLLYLPVQRQRRYLRGGLR